MQWWGGAVINEHSQQSNETTGGSPIHENWHYYYLGHCAIQIKNLTQESTSPRLQWIALWELIDRIDTTPPLTGGNLRAPFSQLELRRKCVIVLNAVASLNVYCYNPPKCAKRLRRYHEKVELCSDISFGACTNSS